MGALFSPVVLSYSIVIIFILSYVLFYLLYLLYSPYKPVFFLVRDRKWWIQMGGYVVWN